MTNPTGRVGKAYLEITADYDKFAREAETKINAALRKVGTNIDSNPFGTKVSQIGANVGDAFQKGFENAVTNEFRAGASRIANTIANSVDNGTNRSRVRRAFDGLGNAAAVGFGSAIALVLGGGQGVGKFLETFKTTGDFVKGIFDSLGSGLGSFLIKAGLGVIIIPHLAGVIFVLIANLTSLLGLLNAVPGLAGIAVGALLPLIIAFQNFGGAISAVLDGDPEKIAEAMKKLAPAARDVVKEFKDLLPTFRSIQQATQQSFFAPIKGALKETIEGIGGDKIGQGLINAGAALGHLVDQFIRLGTAPGVQRLAELLFGNASDAGAISRIIGFIGPPITRLLDGLANAGASTIPTLEKVFERIGGWIDKFANFLNQQAANGEFDQFLKDALQTAGDLKDLMGALLNLLLTIFENTDDGGERFLQKVTAAVDKLSAYFESPEGQAALEAMVALASAFADFLGVAVGFLAQILSLLGAINSLANNTSIGGSFAQAGQTVGGGLRKMATGGVVSGPTFAMVGEAGPEAVIPLNDPARAAQVMGEAGLVPLAENMMAGSALNVSVYLGTQQITEILDQRVERGLTRAGAALGRSGRQS